MANIVFVVSSKPYVHNSTDEAHDLIMASTAYGHQATVVFQDDGVLQLLKQQTPPATQKHAAKRISGFTFFDIEPLIACEESLVSRALHKSKLIDQLVITSQNKIMQIIDNADFIISI